MLGRLKTGNSGSDFFLLRKQHQQRRCLEVVSKGAGVGAGGLWRGGGEFFTKGLYYLEGMIDQLMDRESYRNDVFLYK